LWACVSARVKRAVQSGMEVEHVSGVTEEGSDAPYGSLAGDRKYFSAPANASHPLLPRHSVLREQKCCCCTPFDTSYRIVILVCSCLLTYGSYFIYDNPGALTNEFKEHLCHNSTLSYLAMYSVYSWPNTVQPFIGGWLVDSYLGVGKASIVFSGLVMLGGVVVALSAILAKAVPTKSYVPLYVAIAGRFVFGLGGESLSVAQSTMIGRWFKGHQLATAFAITLSFSRIGSSTNFAISQPIANAAGFEWALWTGALLCLVSFCVAILLQRMDRMGEIAKVVDAVSEEDAGADCSAAGICKSMKPREMFLYSICVCFYVPVFVFISVAADFFTKKYGISEVRCLSTVSFLSWTRHPL
jgi:MFS family permease